MIDHCCKNNNLLNQVLNYSKILSHHKSKLGKMNIRHISIKNIDNLIYHPYNRKFVHKNIYPRYETAQRPLLAHEK